MKRVSLNSEKSSEIRQNATNINQNDPPPSLVIDLPCVVAFHNNCSFAGPNHRGVTQRRGIVVQNISVNDRILKHLAGGGKEIEKIENFF